MLKQQIVDLQDELKHMVQEDISEEQIYTLSVALDKLMIEYYHETQLGRTHQKRTKTEQ
ncbi:MAG: Spo0E family sporulation regulatory protein-aspartic acid phosphatase [Firmicutes bacterium]|nr:Spo0E family sporulation regulatory protein-aspartic acid phosphatase [Bacillota bacterium]